MAAFSRRVNQNRGLWRAKTRQSARQKLLRRAGHEFAIVRASRRRILASRLDGHAIQLDPNERFDHIRQFDAEKPHAAINVQQMPRSGLTNGLTDNLNQPGEEEKVVLKKRIRRDLPSLRRNSEDNLDSAFRRGIGTNTFDFLVQRGLGYSALLDVNHQPIVGTNKPDVETLFEFVPLAADHDAVAIAIELRAGEQRRDDAWIETTNPLEQVNDLFVVEL